jgi:hypothetical protein
MGKSLPLFFSRLPQRFWKKESLDTKAKLKKKNVGKK